MEGTFNCWSEPKNVNCPPHTCHLFLSSIDSSPENSPQLTSLNSVKFCDLQNYLVSSTVGDTSSSNGLSADMKALKTMVDPMASSQGLALDTILFARPHADNINNEALYNYTTDHSSQGYSGSPHSSYSISSGGSHCNDDLAGSCSRNVSPQISSSEEEHLPNYGYQCGTSGNGGQYSGSPERYYIQGQSRVESNAMYSGVAGPSGEGHYGVPFEGRAYQGYQYPPTSVYNRLNSAASDSGTQFMPDQGYQIIQEAIQRCQSSQLSHFHQGQQVPSYQQSNFQLPYPVPPQCHSGNFSTNQDCAYQGYNFSAGHHGATPSPATQPSQYKVTSSVDQVAAPVKRKPAASVNGPRLTRGQGQPNVRNYAKVEGYIEGQSVRCGNQGAVKMESAKNDPSDFASKESSGKLMRYKCPWCSPCKIFANKSNLKTHIMVHTGEKPFHCPECPTSFRQKAHMMKHQITHKKVMKNRPILCMS